MSKSVDLEDWVRERNKDVESRQFRKPLTENHRRYIRTVEEMAVTVCAGPAGTAKTSLACSVAARLFKERKIDKIVLCRPLVECGEKLGTLPGDVNEKTALFVAPLIQALGRHFSPVELTKYRLDERIVVIPLAQMRGLTFDRTFVIADEAQNATFGQLHMLMTRLGFDSKLVVNGDLRQSDIRQGKREDVPLLRAMRLLVREPRRADIGFVLLTPKDVLRPDIVSFIDERLGEDECEIGPVPSYGR